MNSRVGLCANHIHVSLISYIPIMSFNLNSSVGAFDSSTGGASPPKSEREKMNNYSIISNSYLGENPS